LIRRKKMDWNLPYLNDEHKSLIMLMKEFCESEVDIKALNELADKPVPPNATRDDLMARMPWNLLSRAHDVGLRQLPVPTEYGGGGYGHDFVALGALAETGGYYGGEMARLLTISWKNTCSMIYAPKVVQDEVFTDFMQNRKGFLASSASEADHGSDYILPYDEPGATGMYFARREGDEWVLNGEKMWCEGAAVADAEYGDRIVVRKEASRGVPGCIESRNNTLLSIQYLEFGIDL
jgi:alkylation response protein AidB-like acyl-CoA dehydrogenase